jgi:hypothetical protein
MWEETGEICIMRSFIIVLFSKCCYNYDIRRIRRTGHVARKGEKTDAYNVIGKHGGKRQLRRRKRSWEGNVRMDLKRNIKLECGLYLVGSGEGPMTGLCEHCNEFSSSVKC